MRETSVAAYEAILPKLNELQASVYKNIQAAQSRGLTHEELAEMYPSYKSTTSRTRVSELVKLGLVEDSGIRRASSSGRRMIVWVLKRMK